MTRNEILNMPAGRIMDCEIQTRIFEKLVSVKESWHRDLTTKRPGARYRVVKFKSDGLDVPHYSTDIAAAWQVVEKIAVEPLACHLESVNSASGVFWWALFWGDVPNSNEIDEYSAEADTAPLAICRAALLAVMELE